jgi:hypothetical protein
MINSLTAVSVAVSKSPNSARQMACHGDLPHLYHHRRTRDPTAKPPQVEAVLVPQ